MFSMQEDEEIIELAQQLSDEEREEEDQRAQLNRELADLQRLEGELRRVRTDDMVG